MSVFQSQYTRALPVIASEDANIPYPNKIFQSISTNADVNLLVDSAADFIKSNVKVGDIVYNITSSLAATVIQVIDGQNLLVNANIFPNKNIEYIIYNASSQTSNGNPGCYLYIGSDGEVEVLTVGGDKVIFVSLIKGTILPVQVVKVYTAKTTVTSIIALW